MIVFAIFHLSQTFVLLVLAILVSLSSIVCHATLIPALRLLAGVAPQFRAPLLLLLAAAPWLLGLGVLISSVGDLLFGSCDAFSACLWSVDPMRANPLGTVLVAPLLLATLWSVVRLARQRLQTRRYITLMNGVSTPSEGGFVRVLPSDAAVAFAGSGQIYVSRLLRDKLTDQQYKAVLLHEEAHLRRRDGVTQTVATLLASAYLPPFRNRLVNALVLANEQCCDEFAAVTVGRAVTASAILAVERLMRPSATPLPLSFAEGFVATRVRSLLTHNANDFLGGSAWLTMVVLISCGFLLGDILYYAALYVLSPRSFG